MPSRRKQLSIQVDDETAERFERLVSIVSADLGLPLTEADLVRLGLIELEKKHPRQDEPKTKTKRAK
jgi:hypothetical protein